MTEAITLWDIESFRVTAFFSKPVQIENMNLWREITGKDPENKNIQLRLGSVQELGEFNNANMELTVRPERLDVIIQSSDEQTLLPSLGKFPNSIDPFIAAIKPWLQQKQNVTRLALGFVLFQNVPDKSSGYSLLDDLLPYVEIDPIDSSDFSFRINRPRDSGVISGLKNNRLSKWSVGVKAFSALTISGQQNPSITQHEKKFYARLELDLSTAQEFNLESQIDKVPEVFNELQTLALEISQKGDVK